MRDYKQTVRELRDPHFVYHFSRDYLKNMMDDAADTIEELCELVDSNKTAVKHGRWTKIGHIEHTWLVSKCSECGYQTIDAGNYCTNCGAKMDAEGGEEA